MTLLEAAKNVLWKLNRNEMHGETSSPAMIDRNDKVIIDLQSAVDEFCGDECTLTEEERLGLASEIVTDPLFWIELGDGN